MLERHLLVWLFLSSIVAYVWPVGWTFDPFLASKGWMSYLIAAAMLSLGWLLPRDELRQLLRAWPTVLGGTALQYTSMPLLAFLVSVTLPLDDELRLGLVMVGCVPGAMAWRK